MVTNSLPETTAHSQPAFTQGPWKFGHLGTDAFWIGPDFDQMLVARVDHDTEDARDNSRANARLIAAAPEMIEALYQYESDLLYPPTGDSLERRHERVRALIAKAGGDALP